MSINTIIMNALKSIGLPVSFQNYSGNEATYITFFEYSQMGEEYADDEESLTGHYIQVDIWSKSDYTSHVTNVKQLMRDAEFNRLSEMDLYESDTFIYHKAIRFYYLEED